MPQPGVINFDLWEKRYQALDQNLRRLADLIQRDLGSEAIVPKNLLRLARTLRAFAEGQFYFFFNGFKNAALPANVSAALIAGQGGGESFAFKLTPSWEFHLDYVFEATLTQIEIDLALIQQIVQQRIEEDRVYGTAGPLARADKLAMTALKPVLEGNTAGVDPLVKAGTTVMTYFHKAAEVRVIPYAPIALVGIPFTVGALSGDEMDPPQLLRDYLAIGHEIGHYVYRRGENRNDMRVPKALGWELSQKEFPRWVMKWREEIFADVYNCLIAGPLAALSSQEITLQSSRSPLGKRRARLGENPTGQYLIYGQFTNDDGLHPVPFLRPLLFNHVLDKHMNLDGWAMALQKNWINCLNKRFNLSDNDENRFRSDGQYINPPPADGAAANHAYEQRGSYRTFRLNNSNDEIWVDEALGLMRQVIDVIVENCLQNLASLRTVRWSGADDLTDSINNLDTKLYDEILTKQRIDALISEVTNDDLTLSWPDDTLLANPKAFWKEWVDQECFFPGYDEIREGPVGPPPFSTSIAPGKADKLEELEQEPMYTWNHIFHAAGWTTEIGVHNGG